MNAFSRLLTGAALGLAVSILPAAAFAETPANMLVIAHRIDDVTTIDPAESFEFAGSDISRNVYSRLVYLDPMDLDAGYKPDLAESWKVTPSRMVKVIVFPSSDTS
ncbi:MAG: hypothetical protein AAFY59_20345, partial [Pseudomonadota bacterium]